VQVFNVQFSLLSVKNITHNITLVAKHTRMCACFVQ
jgi:hypothetical protein